MTRLRVALADDHPVVLAGVKSLLQATPDMGRSRRRRHGVHGA